MQTYAVVMAGGDGTRFWPLSRQTMPKQLLNISGKDAMINETIKRIQCLVNPNDIFIVVNERQEDTLKKVVGDNCLDEHILIEPKARNTAACICYAAFEIIEKYGDGIMCVFPSDHYIKDTETFEKVLKTAIKIADEKEKLVTIGIQPTFTASAYGYIKYNSNKQYEDQTYEVIEFVEKPDYKKAKQYIESGQYFWNSGMFVWKASAIVENFKRFLPKVYKRFEEIFSYTETGMRMVRVKEIYPTIPSISIDYGILERSDEVVVIAGDFGWNDIGSWDALGAIYDPDEKENIIKGEQINIDTENSTIFSDKRLIATIGIKDLIIVETDDAVLVCTKDRSQDVKKLVQRLNEGGKGQFI